MNKEAFDCKEDIKTFVNEVSPHLFSTFKEFLLFLRSIIDVGIEMTEKKLQKQEDSSIKKVEIK